MALKILTIIGARPQFIKAAPVGRALKNAGIDEKLVHTGQHFDDAMSAIFFQELGIRKPDYNLGINSLSHGAMISQMLEKLEVIILKEKLDIVLIFGDTNSTLAGALAAAKLNIPIAHVEAGLRSFNKRMPEEINRVLADHMSTFLFCPTRNAVDNLKREGIAKNVYAVGDVMLDAALNAAEQAKHSTILETLRLEPKSYAVATIHRAENTDNEERFGSVMDWLGMRAKETPIILPAHPRIKKMLNKSPGLQDIDPLGYLDMTWLVRNACAIYTDSGGLQKEAYFHRVPCVTLRDETEWVETVEAGWNRLWTEPDYKPRREIDEYGSGDASIKIANILTDRLAML
jgi:UDP-GlcNAc3NAcA epimerase